jgi:RNA exonuclease 4
MIVNMSTKVFFTKKQKAIMRERRRKKLLQQEDDVGTASKRKRQRSQDSADDDEMSPTTTIQTPVGLSGKDLRKFRKDARRRARQQGQDETRLIFMGPSEEKSEEPNQSNKKRKHQHSFPRINELLLQQQQERLANQEVELRKQKEDALPESYKNRYVAMDCEMVGIGTDGKQSALARVSLVNWNGETVLDTFVQVPTRVTDFRTHVSGVTPQLLRRNAMEVTKCRQVVADLLKDKILVGHALSNDLQALLLQHPKTDVRDTAYYRPFQRLAGNKWRPRKLRDLVAENLHRSIQGESHDSVEDAVAAMDLFKLVREDWEKKLEDKHKRLKRKK